VSERWRVGRGAPLAYRLLYGEGTPPSVAELLRVASSE
jgi:hypothetical protein